MLILIVETIKISIYISILLKGININLSCKS